MIHGDVVGERAQLSPEALALVEVATGRRFTYAELDRRATACARHWTEELRIEPGERVGLLAHNRVEFIDALAAAARSGITLVPLGTRLTGAELVAIARDCTLTALLHDAEHERHAVEVGEGLPLRHRIPLDPTCGQPTHEDRIAHSDPEPWGGAPRAPEELVCLLYTSGTTGRPKGVMIPQRMIAWNAYNTVVAWELSSRDVTSVFTPLYHAGGLSALMLPVLLAGGTVVLHRGLDADEVIDGMVRERCTVALAVPTILEMLLASPQFDRLGEGCLRWLISGGAPLPRYLADAYAERGVPLRQGFGMTEVGVNGFTSTLEEARRHPGSIGRPMPFTEVRLVDVDGREAAVGEVGEMLFRGPHVTPGYWRAPEATARAIDTDGWLHSGDLARRDEDGFHYVAGRHKDMLISGGVNVYPAEIEAQLLLHPEVTDVAVIGVEDATWGEVGVAYLVTRAPVDDDELRQFLEARLARYKIPKSFHRLESLPRTPYGKVQKHRLRDGEAR